MPPESKRPRRGLNLGEGAGDVSFQAGNTRENTTISPTAQDGRVIIRALDTGRREALRIAIERHMGIDLVDLRVTVDLTESSHIKSPTKKGVSFKVELLRDVIGALHAAEAKAIEMGLLDG